MGGTATFAAVQAQRLGLRVGVVTRAGPELSLSALLPGVMFAGGASNCATSFENTYEGGHRRQLVPSQAEPLTRGDVPSDWRDAPIVLLGPVCGEVPPELQQKVIEIIKRDQEEVYKAYRGMLDDGISRELARINLPLSLYTEWYWQIDLHNLFHFLKLRLDMHAQWEIRQYAAAMSKIAKAVTPWAYESFEEHVLYGASLSRSEIQAIKAMLEGKPCPLEGRLLTEFNQKMGFE